jgi:hypothetical protein
MKKPLVFCILTIVIFTSLTISTAKIETPFDGNDSYGFPLTFFIKLGGKRLPNPKNWTEIFYFNLLIDIIIAFLIAIIIGAIYTKSKKGFSK